MPAVKQLAWLLALLAGSAAAQSKFHKASGACPYLTKPLVRPDGGGLNRHAAGSMVCHQGRARLCEDGQWRDRGDCGVYANKLPQAYEVEGSRPDGGPEDGRR